MTMSNSILPSILVALHFHPLIAFHLQLLSSILVDSMVIKILAILLLGIHFYFLFFSHFLLFHFLLFLLYDIYLASLLSSFPFQFLFPFFPLFLSLIEHFVCLHRFDLLFVRKGSL